MITPRLRFLQLWLTLALLSAGLGLGIAFALGAALDPSGRANALRLLQSTGDLPWLLALMVLGAAGFLAAWIHNRYFLPLAHMREATALAALANSAHRVPRTGPVELRRLGEAIDQLAERYDRAGRSVDERISEVRAALDDERNRLAVLIAELPQGVIVCNAEGRVLLYNEQARTLLCPSQGCVFLGLGRSVYTIVPDPLLREATARLVAADREIDPVCDVVVRAGAGSLRIRIAPVAGNPEAAGESGAAAGFVLLVEALPAEPADAHPAPAVHSRPSAAHRPVFYDFDLFRRDRTDAALDARPVADLSYTVFDTETTGLDPSAGDEIVAIGAVRIVNGRIVPDERFDCLVDPRRAIDPASQRVHGLSAAQLHGAPSIQTVLPRFHAFCADTVLVGHNIAFDLRFLQLKERASGVRFGHPVLDTLLLSAVLQENGGDDRLEAIAHRFGVELVARHTALGDALLAARVFLKMLPLLAARGIVTLRQVQEASRRTRYARLRY